MYQVFVVTIGNVMQMTPGMQVIKIGDNQGGGKLPVFAHHHNLLDKHGFFHGIFHHLGGHIFSAREFKYLLFSVGNP